MDKQILIEELSPTESNVILESTQNGKDMFLRGVMMQAAMKNRNGRNYPITEIQGAVTSAQQRIKEYNGIFGELDHPQTLTINLDRISHVITEMKMEGNNAIGKAKILDTPMGLIAKELVKSGTKIGFSSRGAGAVTESGDVSGFSFVTMDIVATPSAPGAIPESIYESVGMSKRGTEIMSLAESVRHDEAAQKYLKREILRFIDELKLR